MSALGGGGNLNYKIGGQLPFQPAGNPILGTAQIGAGLGMPQGVVQGLDTLAQQYGQSYQSALSQNQAMYNNILQGYQQLMGNQVSAQGGIQQGYSNLKGEVLGDISNIGASEKQAIIDAYTQQQGQQSQGLINRGLGNATVMDSMNRGLTFDEQKAQIALQNQMAQLTAGYASNLGLAGLGYANQANMQNTALGAQQLGWMNSVTSGYPDPNQYNALFGQAGQLNAANLDRRLATQIAQARTNPFGGAGGGQGGRIQVGQMPGLSSMGTGSYGGDYGMGGMGGYIGGGGFGGGLGGQYASTGGYAGQGQNLVIDPNTGQLVDQSQLSDNFGPYAGGQAYSPQDAPWAGGDPSLVAAEFSQADPNAQAGGGNAFTGDINNPLSSNINDPSSMANSYAMDPMLIDPTMSGQSYDFSGYGSPGDFSGMDLGGGSYA